MLQIILGYCSNTQLFNTVKFQLNCFIDIPCKFAVQGYSLGVFISFVCIFNTHDRTYSSNRGMLKE